MKLGLSVTLLASIVIFIFSSFSGQLGWWFKYPDCNPRVIQNSQISLYNTTTKEEDYYLKTNISHVLFGIGGSVKTWKNRRQYNELWWKQNVTRGFVWLDENPDSNEPWLKTSPPYKVSKRSSKSAARIARIVLESFQLGLEDVRWFVMGDDDTVFFTDNLVTVLSKYDHNEMYYIGGISESIEQNLLHSYGMAFGGGGGFAISYPLAQVLFETLDGCLDRYEDLYDSDERIHSCLAEIGVPLTIEVGFHQVGEVFQTSVWIFHFSKAKVYHVAELRVQMTKRGINVSTVLFFYFDCQCNENLYNKIGGWVLTETNLWIDTSVRPTSAFGTDLWISIMYIIRWVLVVGRL